MVARFQAEDASSPPLFVLSSRPVEPGSPDGGKPRRTRGPLVESGRRGPGHRPCIPDRTTPGGAGTQACLRGTVEEKIAAMIRDKRGLAAKIVGTGEQWLTELSTGQLAELLRLEAGAVVE